MNIPSGATHAVIVESGNKVYFKCGNGCYIWKDNQWVDALMAEESILEKHGEPIAEDTVSNILQQRESQYGSYGDVARITQAIKSQLATGSSYDELSDEQKLSLDMIANKMARAVNGDVNYIDNWNDICGYSQLVVDNLLEKLK